MKHMRLLVLTTLILVALFAAVLPALAANPFGPLLNWSFEFDDDNNGVPNNWHLHGESIIHVCGKPSAWMADDCLMAFLADDDERSVLYQDLDFPSAPMEEGVSAAVLAQWSAAHKLESNRIFGGWIAGWTTGEQLTVYGPVPGGTYNFSAVLLTDFLTNSELLLLDTLGRPDHIRWGWMSLPGDGRAYVDYAQPVLSTVMGP